MSEKIIKLGTAKVVRHEAFDATVEARQIIDAAHAKASSIVQDAELAREKEIESARAEGYERGLQEWNAAIAAVDAARDRYAVESEPELVRLAVRIAGKIIGEELQTSPEAIVSIVRECLHGLRRERSLTIRAQPDDVDILRGRIDRLREAAGPDRSIEVVADPAVGPGGCIVESEYGFIDARLETQLRCMETILLRTARK